MIERRTNETCTRDQLLDLYRVMYRIRTFELTATDLFKKGVIKGTAHSYAGQEAVAAGVCAHLNPEDYIASYHRGHGHCLAKGARPDRMMAELMGKDSGYCHGLGGSMHIADTDLNILGANGIVAAALPLASGAALAAQLAGAGRVAVAFFGDGAANQGIFHEAMNLAAVWRLPMLFVCENNGFALNTAYQDTTAVGQIAHRAAAYSMPGTTVDGNDVEAVFHAAGAFIERARQGEGPALLEAMTWRWGPHSMRANLREPRTEEDMEAWRKRDPLVIAENRMTRFPGHDRADLDAISSSIDSEMGNAIEFAEAGTDPTLTTLADILYAPATGLDVSQELEPGTRSLTYTEALNEALRQEMESDPSVILMGEDIGKTGGIFQVTKGLFDQFGPSRVRDTPISEAAFCGAGVGAAIAGLRPVVEVQIFDFVTQMMDMIVNQAAKFRFMMGGRARVPLVVRGPQGGGIRLAAQHSQSLEAWFAHIPGLIVVAPSTPYDAKGLLAAAIRSDNPVIFLEHKMLYLGQTSPVPEERYVIPLGKADTKRRGNDVTVVASQVMVGRALAAATRLERDGVDCEVIDLRTIYPLDRETIVNSVRKTNRLVIVHEACKTGGIGAEVASVVMEEAFDFLDAPIIRVGALDVPIPFNDTLENLVIPSQQKIVEAVLEVMGGAGTRTSVAVNG